MVYVDIVLVIYQLLLLVPHNDYLIGGCKCPGGKDCKRKKNPHQPEKCTGQVAANGLCAACAGNLIYHHLYLLH